MCFPLSVSITPQRRASPQEGSLFPGNHPAWWGPADIPSRVWNAELEWIIFREYWIFHLIYIFSFRGVFMVVPWWTTFFEIWITFKIFNHRSTPWDIETQQINRLGTSLSQPWDSGASYKHVIELVYPREIIENHCFCNLRGSPQFPLIQ